MADSGTPQPAASTGGTEQTQAPAPEWQGTFKTDSDMWTGYRNLKAQYDKVVADKGKGGAQPQAQGKWDFSTLAQGYTNLAQRIDMEAAKGQFSPEVAGLFEAMGADPAYFQESIQYRQSKRLEPLKQFIDGDHAAILKTVAENIDETTRQAFEGLLAAGQHEAAAAVVKNVLAKVQGNGEAPKIGQVGGNSGGGYGSYEEFQKDFTSPQHRDDDNFRAAVQRKYNATSAALRAQWRSQVTDGTRKA
jgi:hypothetical protein